jgi:hypothetical protein
VNINAVRETLLAFLHALRDVLRGMAQRRTPCT